MYVGLQRDTHSKQAVSVGFHSVFLSVNDIVNGFNDGFCFTDPCTDFENVCP